MQNHIQKFRQISIVFEKPGILCKNLKTLTSFEIPAKVLNSMVVGARQSFQFFRQKTWFLGINTPFAII